MYDILYLFLIFIVYSFLGYLLEVSYCSFVNKKIVNRGFLFGPICPIYGLGAILTLLSLSGFKENPVIVFFMGMLITSTLEYYTSYIFEKIFHNKWWDYSYRSDNINGRICLRNSIGFGIGIVLTIYIINPFINNLINMLSNTTIIIISSVILFIFIIDLIWSIMIAYNLKSRLIVAEELKAAKLRIIPKLFERKHFDTLSKIKFKSNRLIKNYPNLAKDLRKELSIIKDMIVDTKNIKKAKEKKKM